MAYSAPTIEQFRTRFPEFTEEEVPDETLQLFLDEAIAEVGDNWIDADRRPAILFLTAHNLSAEGYGSSGGSSSLPVDESTGAYLKRRRVGDVEVEFATASDLGGGGRTISAGLAYQSSPYGRRYWEIRQRNFPAVLVV